MSEKSRGWFRNQRRQKTQQTWRHEIKTDSRALGYACSWVFISFSSLSGSLIGLLLACTLALKYHPPGYQQHLPWHWWAPLSQAGRRCLRYSSPSLLRTFNSRLINPSTGRSQKQFFRRSSCASNNWKSAGAGDKCGSPTATPLPVWQGRARRCHHHLMRVLWLLLGVLGVSAWLPARRELQGLCHFTSLVPPWVDVVLSIASWGN